MIISSEICLASKWNCYIREDSYGAKGNGAIPQPVYSDITKSPGAKFPVAAIHVIPLSIS